MKLPVVQGVIRRRLLINFRVDPDVMARHLPPPFQPRLQRGFAVAGICLIRLERMRPAGLPLDLGFTSENAAHRVAVLVDSREGLQDAVYVPRRDSDSWMNRIAGGRLFSGKHHAAEFRVEDDGTQIDLRMRSRDGSTRVEVTGTVAPQLPGGSIFASLREASDFFEHGSLGYSSSPDPARFDAITLQTQQWSVSPFAVSRVSSSYFEDVTRFPPSCIAFDHALVMRDLQHRWRTERALYRQVAAAPGL